MTFWDVRIAASAVIFNNCDFPGRASGWRVHLHGECKLMARWMLCTTASLPGCWEPWLKPSCHVAVQQNLGMIGPRRLRPNVRISTCPIHRMQHFWGLLHSSRAVVFWALTVTCLTVHFGALAKVMCFESLFFGGRKLVALNWGYFAHAATSIPPAGYLKHRVPTRGKLKLQDPAGDTHATRCQNTGEIGEMGKSHGRFFRDLTTKGFV